MKKALLAVPAVILTAVLVPLIQGCGGSGDYEVRAVFDNGSFVVPGEDVRVAGANVGSVKSIDVSMPDETVSADPDADIAPGKAVIVMTIKDKGFQDFRDDASCIIRPQSLIGEKFIDCSVTQPRPPDTEAPPELAVIPKGEPGAGQRLLPIENNGHSVDQDLINNIYRLPYAQRLRVILNELGIGLATRGPELARTLERANPTLKQVNRVLDILASNNKRMANLARDGAYNLTRLAAKRKNMTGFFKSAGYVAAATAERGDDQRENLRNLPATLRELRATFSSLENFAGNAQPAFAAIKPHAKDVSEVTTKLKPFAEATTRSLTALGKATRTAGPDLVASRPMINKLTNQAKLGKRPATDLRFFLGSTRQNMGFRNLLKLLYGNASALNGYDQFGHFQRTNVLVTPCTPYQEGAAHNICAATWWWQREAAASSLSQVLPELDLPGEDQEAVPEDDQDAGAAPDVEDDSQADGEDDATPGDGDGQAEDPDAEAAGEPAVGTAASTGQAADTGKQRSAAGKQGRSKRASRSGNELRSRMSILDYLLGG